MIRVLLISEDFGISAPGLVAEKVVKGLKSIEGVEVDVITTKASTSSLDTENVKCLDKGSYYRLEKLSFYFFGTDLLSSLWAKRALRTISKEYDLVFSVVSMFHYSALLLEQMLYDRHHWNASFFAYFVDAIPAPSPYLRDSILRTRLARFIRSNSRALKVVFSTCQEMALYQKQFLRAGTRSIELLNPTLYSGLRSFRFNSRSSPTFLYTGGIYFPRTPLFLLRAFERVVLEYPNAKLVFVGTSINTEHYCSSDLLKNVHLFPFQTDLIPYYASSWALLDIGSNVEKDIYLSSKVTGYITINRPIICEASKNSPARRLFKDFSSIYLCEHDAFSIYTAMKDVILHRNDYSFEEREPLIKAMSSRNCANVITNILSEG